MLNKNIVAKARTQALINPNPPGSAHVAALAQLGNSLWTGINNKKTHPDSIKIYKSGKSGSCIHAEVDAIVKIPRDARHKIKLFVMRFLKCGKLTMAKPCKTCQCYLEKEGINTKNVYYTNWQGEWEKLK